MREVIGWICLALIVVPTGIGLIALQIAVLWRACISHVMSWLFRYSRKPDYEYGDQGFYMIFIIEVAALIMFGAGWGLDGVF